MSYYLHNPYFYLPKSTHSNQTHFRSHLSQISYVDYKSNLIPRKAQLIQEESMLRRLKATSIIQVTHREQQILAMKVKYQLQGLKQSKLKQKERVRNISKESQLILQSNRMQYAVIEGCRNANKQNLLVKGHIFPSYISSTLK